MPESRCDLVLLGWTVFVGFNLISDYLWSSGNPSTSNSSSPSTVGSTNIAGSTSELYTGAYTLEANGSVVEEGALRLMLSPQQTSIASVQIASLSMSLIRSGRWNSFASSQADLHFSGIEFSEVGKWTASGVSDPDRFKHFGSHPCRLDAAVHLGSVAGGKRVPGDSVDNVEPSEPVTGEVAAVDCGFALTFEAKEVDVLRLTRRVVHYSIWANVLTILQMRCYVMQMRHTEEGPSAAKVSVICIAMQALMDSYDSFLHLCLGLSSQYMFNTIAVVSLFKFILFSLLEARYLLTIWRHRRHDAFSQGWDAVRRELSWLYSRFYGVLLVGIIVIYSSLEHLDLIVFVFQGFWIPQILHDAWHGSRSAITPKFMLGIAVTRTLPVLYLWGCPEGIFSGDLYPRLPGSPSLFFCVLVVAFQAAQVALMGLQRRWGPRWFVPWVCMPWAYDYHRSTRIEPGTDCVICMADIDPEDAQRVSTPCGHKFHRICLEQWMDVKMECPTCRTTLPPIQ